MDNALQSIRQSILDGENEEILDQVTEALHRGLTAQSILEAMISAMGEVGRLFEEGEYFIPEMLISARAMQAGMSMLKPHLQEAQIKAAGRVAIGTVKGDLHDIGKNLVGMMLEGAGMEVIDLGVDVPVEKFVELADQVDVVALSALLTTSMPRMETVIEALQAAGKRGKVKVIIGGAPVTAAYAEQIGADGFAPDASSAVAMVNWLLEGETKG